MPPTPKAQSTQQKQGLPPTQNAKLLFCVTDEKKAHFHLFATTLVLSLVAHPLPCRYPTDAKNRASRETAAVQPGATTAAGRQKERGEVS